MGIQNKTEKYTILYEMSFLPTQGVMFETYWSKKEEMCDLLMCNSNIVVWIICNLSD